MTTSIRRARVLAPATLACALALAAFGCGDRKDEVTITTDTTGTSTPAPGATAPGGDTTLAGAPGSQNTMPVAPTTPPEHVEVVHVLVAFDGSIPNAPPVGRTREQAEQLAADVLRRARQGEDFDALMVQYSNDTEPGVLYKLANTGVTPNKSQGEYGRSEMVKGFSDVAFGLSPGNIGMAEYDPKNSPFGWHIIKRLK